MSRAGVLFGTLLVAACVDGGDPLTTEAPVVAPPVELAQLECTVATRERTLSCSSPSASKDARTLIVGGQGENVFLQASNHQFVAGNYSIDVTVQNLIAQALGVDAAGAADTQNGVRVFFDEEPVATEGVIAPISVLNETGTEMFMRADQIFYQYDEVLATNATSAPKTWQFSMDPGTTRFRFKVYVAAQVRFPEGWVDVSPGADTLVVGATAALAPTVRGVTGRTLADQTVTWGTSNPGVATVDAAGSLTAVSPGLATITATSATRTGSATVVICPNLEVGGVYTASMPLASSLCFAGGAGAAAEYVYVPLNHSPTSALALSVTGSGIVAAAGPPSPALMPGSALHAVGERALASADDWHMRHLEAQNRALTGLLRDPRARVTPGTQRSGARRLITKGVPAVGDLMTLNTADNCAGARVDQIGRVVSVGQRIILVADTLNPSGGFTTAQFDSIAAEFDTLAYPINVENFGTPTDLDGNGRVVAFYTRTVNQLTPPGSNSITAGYVNARDLFNASPTGSCPRSNEGEIFYMRVPDPAGAFGPPATVASVRSGTVATLAHEFQHLINSSRRIYFNGASSYEVVWLNEGLSHIAEELMYHRVTGLTPRSNITINDMTVPSRLDAYSRYMIQNISRYRSYLARPDTAGAFKNSGVLAVRGAIWSFLRYAADRRNGNDAEFWFSLVNSKVAGTANLQAVLAENPTTWQRDWVASLYADDVVPGIDARYQITSWNMRSVYSGVGNGVYPLLTRALTNGVAFPVTYSAGGGSTFFRFGVPANSFAGVTALSAGAPVTTPYGFIVVRTK